MTYCSDHLREDKHCFFFFFKDFIYLKGGGADGKRESQADSLLSTEPNYAGTLDLMTLRPLT